MLLAYIFDTAAPNGKENFPLYTHLGGGTQILDD